MKIIAKNKRARFDYDITDTLTAGLILRGTEVKSVKDGSISLKGSYIRFINDVPHLTGAHISPYAPAATQHEPERDRPLLLHKAEIARLRAAQNDGQHILPLAVGLVRNLVKLEIGLGTSRKKHDKREVLKRRDARRQIDRALKR
ncbi:MAG: SsrA-binding protein SmpB [Candidatus Saccharimonadales bacterium]